MTSPSIVTSPLMNFGKTMTLPGSWVSLKGTGFTCGRMAMAELKDPRREINPARAIRIVLVGFMGALHGVAPSNGRGQRSRVQFVAIVTFAPVGSAKVTHITP